MNIKCLNLIFQADEEASMEFSTQLRYIVLVFSVLIEYIACANDTLGNCFFSFFILSGVNTYHLYTCTCFKVKRKHRNLCKRSFPFYTQRNVFSSPLVGPVTVRCCNTIDLRNFFKIKVRIVLIRNHTSVSHINFRIHL